MTRNPALILRLTGLSFEIQFAQGAAVRSSMVLRLVKEFGQHDPAYAATLLAVGALYYAERWELKDAAELLRYGSGFKGSASAQCLAIAGPGRNPDGIHQRKYRKPGLQVRTIRHRAGGRPPGAGPGPDLRRAL